MDKAPDAFRTISEVAEVLDTPAHVLRFWESRFPQIRPVKRAGGRRYYRPSDVALLAGIRHLLHDEGMTIRGVQKVLRESGVRYVQALSGGTEQDFGDHAETAAIEAALSAQFQVEVTPKRPAQVGAEIVALPRNGRPTPAAAAPLPSPIAPTPAAEAEQAPEAPFIEAVDEPADILFLHGQAEAAPAEVDSPVADLLRGDPAQTRADRLSSFDPGADTFAFLPDANADAEDRLIDAPAEEDADTGLFDDLPLLAALSRASVSTAPPVPPPAPAPTPAPAEDATDRLIAALRQSDSTVAPQASADDAAPPPDALPVAPPDVAKPQLIDAVTPAAMADAADMVVSDLIGLTARLRVLARPVAGPTRESLAPILLEARALQDRLSASGRLHG